MSDDGTAAELAAYLWFASTALKALPEIDEEAERGITALLNRRPLGYQPRKLRRK